MIDISFLAIRQSLFLSPSEAASRLGVSNATYRKWEQQNPPDPLAAFAALAGGISVPDTRAAAIRSARLAAGLTQGQAAAAAGVRVLTWARWESGRTRAPLWRLALFASRAAVAPVAAGAPTGEEVRAARLMAGLSPTAAADLAHCRHFVNWVAVEEGRAAMPLDAWELFRFKVARGPGFVDPGLPTGDVLRAARLAAGLTQGQAAAAVCVKRSAWAAWESGRNVIPRLSWELFVSKS